ncbi:MAG: c-type cytochrome, partial [Anaerolineae bacterium]
MKKKQAITLSLLLFLAGLVLTACGSVALPALPAAQETAVQPPTASTANTTQQTGDWDAAAFFATTCASCHGSTGEGSAIAPSLNREEIRTADTAWLIETISYGRPGTAMPAWSVESGGPLSSDQIA